MGNKIMLTGVFLLVCSTALATTTPVIDYSRLSSTTEVAEHGSPTESFTAEGVTKTDGLEGESNKIISADLSDLFYSTAGNKFYVSKILKDWDDASKSCKDVGMELASITSQKEQLELLKFLFLNDLIPEDDYSGYWLSGHQLENGLYNWTSINRPIGCWGWLPGEPSHVDNLEHCVELKHEAGSVRLGWNNFFCERLNRFICEQLPVYDKQSLSEQEATNPEVNEKPETECYYFYNIYYRSNEDDRIRTYDYEYV